VLLLLLPPLPLPSVFPFTFPFALLPPATCDTFDEEPSTGGSCDEELATEFRSDTEPRSDR
jgi:hypothetical protein